MTFLQNLTFLSLPQAILTLTYSQLVVRWKTEKLQEWLWLKEVILVCKYFLWGAKYGSFWIHKHIFNSMLVSNFNLYSTFRLPSAYFKVNHLSNWNVKNPLTMPDFYLYNFAHFSWLDDTKLDLRMMYTFNPFSHWI